MKEAVYESFWIGFLEKLKQKDSDLIKLNSSLEPYYEWLEVNID